MTYATTPDGTRIAYQLQGNGAPLVLLAGQANNHHWWDLVRADFHPARSTLTLDYRGTGDSDKPDTPTAPNCSPRTSSPSSTTSASAGPTSTARPWAAG
jgi:pimeloyl-ACP methyl ester carboxylesterase